PRQVEIQDEVLPEALPRRYAVPGDYLPQWRQIGRIGASLRQVADRRAAICAASFSAAIRLSGLATPWPAMSKAVPWSGEVRMNGSPSVTLTAPSKSSVFIGISAWSWYMQRAAS